MAESMGLPLDSEGFREQVSLLFSLDRKELADLLDLLEKRLDKFTSYSIIDLLGVSPYTAQSDREILAFLIHQFLHHVKPDKLRDQLVEIGCAKDKVDDFVNRLSGFPKEAIDVGDLIWEAEELTYNSERLAGSSVEFSYEYVDFENRESVLVPILTLNIISTFRRGERHRLSMRFTADKLSAFLLQLEGSSMTLSAESAKLKSALGDKFYSLTEEVDLSKGSTEA